MGSNTVRFASVDELPPAVRALYDAKDTGRNRVKVSDQVIAHFA